MVDPVDEHAVQQLNEFDLTEAQFHGAGNFVLVAKIRSWRR